MNRTDEVLLELAKKGNTKKMLEEAESHEIHHYDVPLSPTFYLIVSMGYLIEGDLINARQVLKRLSPAAQKDATLAKVSEVVNGLWNREAKAAILVASSIQFPPLDAMLLHSLVLRVARTQAKAYDHCSILDVVAATGVSEHVVRAAIETSAHGSSPLIIKPDNSISIVPAAAVSEWKGQGVERVTEVSLLLRKPLT
jgi:hypothetical protein